MLGWMSAMPIDTVKRTIRVTSESHPSTPTLDTAVSRALLQRVSAGEEPETLRLYKPGAIVAFGPQDVRSSGYADAVEAARRGGFDAVRRLAGGRAAVFHEETIAFSWAIPDPDPRASVDRRFEEIADIMTCALRRLGIDARVGEVAGEYCPGRYSVNARGSKKLMGVGQRLISRAAHVGGVIVVADSHRVRDILLPVYDALQLKWDSSTVGSVRDEAESVGYAEVQEAVLDEFGRRHYLHEHRLDEEILALAQAIESEHVP